MQKRSIAQQLHTFVGRHIIPFAQKLSWLIVTWSCFILTALVNFCCEHPEMWWEHPSILMTDPRIWREHRNLPIHPLVRAGWETSGGACGGVAGRSKCRFWHQSFQGIWPWLASCSYAFLIQSLFFLLVFQERIVEVPQTEVAENPVPWFHGTRN